MPIVRFDSPADLARALEKRKGKHTTRNLEQGRSGWTGESMRDSLKFAKIGNQALVADAEKLMAKFELEATMPHVEWAHDVAGAYPDVPAALMGSPEPMRAKRLLDSDRAPLRVYVCTTSSAGLQWEMLQKRGVAILALVMGLAAVRPVELHTFTAMDNGGSDAATREDKADKGAGIVITRIGSAPLDLATACFALCSIGFDRNMTHAYGFDFWDFGGGWAWHAGNDFQDPESRVFKRMRKCLDAGPHDLVIGPSWLEDPLVHQPEEFIRKHLAVYGHAQPEDEGAYDEAIEAARAEIDD